MKEIKLAKTDAGFNTLSQWYDRFYEQLSYPKETRRIETSFGYTDVVMAGPKEEPPVVLLHGAGAGAPFVLHEIVDLPKRMRFLSINIPGQSTHAAQHRLSFKTDEYARWLGEVLDAFELEAPTIAGVSWGGSVALQLAKHQPQRIGGLILVVPGSIVSGPFFEGLRKIAWPMMRYAMSASEENRDRALENLATDSCPMWTPYLGEVLRVFNTDFSVPPLLKPEELAELSAKVFVIAAEHDLSFPGQPLLDRSKELFPNLVGTHLLADSRHIPSFAPEARAAFAALIEQAVAAVRG